jgi:hypothetical protein
MALALAWRKRLANAAGGKISWAAYLCGEKLKVPVSEIARNIMAGGVDAIAPQKPRNGISSAGRSASVKSGVWRQQHGVA